MKVRTRRTDLVHTAITLEVTFVPNDDDGNCIRVFDPQDLLVIRLNHLKRVSFRDGVHEEKALAVEHIVLPHRTVVVVMSHILKKAKKLPQNRARSEYRKGDVTISARDLTITNFLKEG